MVVTVQYVLLHPSLEEALQCDLQRKEKQSSGWKENTHRGERQTDRLNIEGNRAVGESTTISGTVAGIEQAGSST